MTDKKRTLEENIIRDILQSRRFKRRVLWSIETHNRARERSPEARRVPLAERRHEEKREIERTLQALRKAGQIAYRPWGWHVLETCTRCKGSGFDPMTGWEATRVAQLMHYDEHPACSECEGSGKVDHERELCTSLRMNGVR